MNSSSDVKMLPKEDVAAPFASFSSPQEALRAFHTRVAMPAQYKRVLFEPSSKSHQKRFTSDWQVHVTDTHGLSGAASSSALAVDGALCRDAPGIIWHMNSDMGRLSGMRLSPMVLVWIQHPGYSGRKFLMTMYATPYAWSALQDSNSPFHVFTLKFALSFWPIDLPRSRGLWKAELRPLPWASSARSSASRPAVGIGAMGALMPFQRPNVHHLTKRYDATVSSGHFGGYPVEHEVMYSLSPSDVMYSPRGKGLCSKSHFLTRSNEYLLRGAFLRGVVGSGKTVQTIALLQHVFAKAGGARALVVVPKNLVSQWANQLQRFFLGCDADVLVVANVSDARKMGQERFDDGKSRFVIVTTLSFLNGRYHAAPKPLGSLRDGPTAKHVDSRASPLLSLHRCRYDVLALDEAHDVESSSMHWLDDAIARDFTLLISGTPCCRTNAPLRILTSPMSMTQPTSALIDAKSELSESGNGMYVGGKEELLLPSVSTHKYHVELTALERGLIACDPENVRTMQTHRSSTKDTRNVRGYVDDLLKSSECRAKRAAAGETAARRELDGSVIAFAKTACTEESAQKLLQDMSAWTQAPFERALRAAVAPDLPRALRDDCLAASCSAFRKVQEAKAHTKKQAAKAKGLADRLGMFLKGEVGEYECPICYETEDSACPDKSPFVTTQCGHIGCLGCFEKHRQSRQGHGNTCPTCRQPIDKLYRLRQEEAAPDNEKALRAKHGSKLVAVAGLLRRLVSGGDKVVCITEWPEVTALVAERLAEAGIAAAAVKGGYQERTRTIERFLNSNPRRRGGELAVLLLTVGNESGMDLGIAANHVVFYHALTTKERSSVVTQAIARVRRLGQPRDTVHVHHVVTEGTYEQRLFERTCEEIGAEDAALQDV